MGLTSNSLQRHAAQEVVEAYACRTPEFEVVALNASRLAKGAPESDKLGSGKGNRLTRAPWNSQMSRELLAVAQPGTRHSSTGAAR